jgi:hypothetical protein
MYQAWLENMAAEAPGIEKRTAGNLTLGYVTNDSCPRVEDDTPRVPLPYFSVLHYIASPSPCHDTPVIAARVLGILNSIQALKNSTVSIPGPADL